MNGVFQVKSSAPYYLRDKNELYSRNPKTGTYGTEAVSFMAPNNLHILSKKYKEMETKLSMSVL